MLRRCAVFAAACLTAFSNAQAQDGDLPDGSVYQQLGPCQLFQQPDQRRLYVQANLVSGVSDFSSFGGSGLLEATLLGKDEDVLFGAGGSIGLMCDYDEHRCRCELEAMGFQNNRYSVLGTDGFNFFILPAKLQQSTLMGNLWYDRTISDTLNLFVGGGLGGADIDMAVNTGGSTSYGGATNFAWQVGGGVTRKISSDLELDLGYRYLDCGDVHAFIPGGDVSTDVHSHEVMLSRRWYVW